MNIKNKIISCILALILFGSISPVMAEEYTADVYSDYEISEYAQNVAIFRNIGIFDIENDIHDIVKRDEFAYMLTGFLGYGELAEAYGAKNSFDDLGENQNSVSIECAYGLGLISATGYRKFSPNDKLTPSVMVRGIIAGLGYGHQPDGSLSNSNDLYWKKAGELNVLDKNSYKDESYAVTYGELIKAFKNALSANVMKVRFKNGGFKEWYVADGDNILNTVHQCEEFKGIITATKYSDLYGGAELSDGHIAINGEVFSYEPEISNLLGYSVRYFIKDTGDDRKLVYVCKDLKKNDEKTLESEDLVQYQNRVYSYYTENYRQRKITLQQGVSVIYNGRSNVSAEKTVNMLPDKGLVKFLDNNQDGKYDVIFIEDYETIVVGSTDTVKKILYDKFEENKKLSVENIREELLSVKTTLGKEMSFEKIAVGSVVDVAMSADGMMCNMIISTAKASGILTSMDSDTASIDDVKYELAKKTYGFDTLNVGDDGTIHLDKDNQIVYIEKGQAAYEAAYLINVYLEENGEDLSAKLCNSTGNLEYLKFSNKVYINDQKEKNPENVLKKFYGEGTTEVQSQLVMLKRDAKGEIYRVYTVHKDSDETCPANGFRFYSSISGEESKYISASRRFKDNKTVLSATCKIFMIPEDVKSADADDFSVITPSGLKNDQTYGNTSRPLMSYIQGQDSLLCDYIVASSQYRKNSRIGIVKNICEAVNEDGDLCKEINYYAYSGEETIYLYQDEGIDIDRISPLDSSTSTEKYSLSTGDVIYYDYIAVNGQEKIISLSMLYDVEADTYLAKNPSTTDANASSVYYMADVWNKKAGYVGMAITGGNEISSNIIPIGPGFKTSAGNYRIEDLSGTPIYRYNPEGRRAEILTGQSTSDIITYNTSDTDYSRIIVLSVQGKAQYAYLVK